MNFFVNENLIYALVVKIKAKNERNIYLSNQNI